LNLTYRRATYVAALGLDHRIGWLEVGALGTLVMSIIIHIQSLEWKVIQRPTDSVLSAMTRDNLSWTFLEIALAGLIQDFLLMATNQYGTLLFFQAIFYSLARFVTHGGGLFLVIILSVFVGLNMKRILHFLSRGPRKHPEWWSLLLAACFVPTIILQIYQDAEERHQIEQGIYWPWNYRWAVPVMKLVWWHI
jgi:hypothetical protein